MARERMVTRTIETATVTVLCIDTETAEPMNRTVEMPVIKDEAKMLKAIRKAHETDTFKIVSIVSTEIHKALYGMSEAEFINTARVIDK